MPSNYKKLRSALKRSHGIENMKVHRNKVLSSLKDASRQSATESLTSSFGNVSVALTDFAQSCIMATENSIERTVLIERQIDNRDFQGKLHDEYHEYSQKLMTNYNSSIQNAKRLSNTISTLIYELLPHHQRARIRGGSFGKLYLAFKSSPLSLSGEPFDSIKALIVRDGRYFEEVVHEYRDKVIEHSRSDSHLDLENILIRDDRVDIINRKEIIPRTNILKGDEIDPYWQGFVYHEISDTKGSNGNAHKYYVHAHLHNDLNDLEEGQKINKGEAIAFTTDGGSGHFKKYGEHMHEFMSENFHEVMPSTDSFQFGMPGIGELLLRYLSFCEELLAVINKHQNIR